MFGTKFADLARKGVPQGLRRAAERVLLPLWVPSDRSVWNLYAYVHRFNSRVGDEWNRPDLLGLDVQQSKFIEYLDGQVFSPIIERFEPEVILEIGSGGGRISEILVSKCRRLIVSDISRGMLHILRRRFGEMQSVDYMRLNGRDLCPIENGSIDMVVSYDVFVHLNPWDIFNYLREIERVLKSSGVALIHHANTFSDRGWRRFTEVELPRQLGRHKEPQNFTPMTQEMMAEFARRAGLKVVKCDTTSVPRDAISILAKS